jgi:phosphomannomutase
MLASAVSSAALGAMAAAEGFNFEQTLTGFKWLGNIAKQKQAQGLTVLFAFEEAIGFMFPATNMVSCVASVVWDMLHKMQNSFELVSTCLPPTW